MDLKRGRVAKEGLIQYRIACQQVNVASLEEVRRRLRSWRLSLRDAQLLHSPSLRTAWYACSLSPASPR